MNVVNTIIQFIIYLSLLLAPKDADRITIKSPTAPDTAIEINRTGEGGWFVKQASVSIADGTLKMGATDIPLEARERGFLATITTNDWLKTSRLALDAANSLEKTSDGFIYRLKEGEKTQEFRIQYHRAAAAVGADAKSGVEAPQTKVAVAAAEAWLAGIDAGNYAQSWKGASVFFQKAITETNWSDALTKTRKPLGALKSRKLLNAKSAKVLPGAPDGEYVVMQFDASFAAKEKALETVTFLLEQDGSWKAAGYFIK